MRNKPKNRINLFIIIVPVIILFILILIGLRRPGMALTIRLTFLATFALIVFSMLLMLGRSLFGKGDQQQQPLPARREARQEVVRDVRGL